MRRCGPRTSVPAGTTATTLDALGTPGLGYALDPPIPACHDAAPVPYSLDADVWKGGAPRMGAFDDTFRMNFFTGPPMAAVLQTGLFSPVPGRRALCQRVPAGERRRDGGRADRRHRAAADAGDVAGAGRAADRSGHHLLRAPAGGTCASR